MTNAAWINNGKDLYIEGQWQKSTGEPFFSKNPANGQGVWQGHSASKEEIQAANEAAHRALASWAALDFATRADYTQRFARQVESKRQDLARLISEETGKPFWESLTEVNAVIGKINLSIQAYQERNAEKQNNTSEAIACLRFKPHGVVAVLGAFNFPAHLSNGHIVPALLAGNTVIYKPSELAPAVAKLLLQCWHESGLPAGVINCVQGKADCGKTLLETDLQGVYFTGSYRTGKQIHQHFSDRPEVILALEMGGNNPLLIDEPENTKAAVYHTLLSTLITAGQRCSCARRVLIPNTPGGDYFLTQFIKACTNTKVGAFTEQPEPFIGPVISEEHALMHLQAQEELLALGGESLLSMSLLASKSGLLSPGIIDMTQVANPPDEEIFAPLVQVYRYQDFEEALNLANKTRYGLVAGFLGDNLERYQQFYRTVRAGLINWNRPTTGALSSLPFGGVGCSGNHRPSAYFAADYCAYPIASLEQPLLTTPVQLLPGITLE